MAAARDAGLSIRQIGTATGPSHSHVHPLRSATEAQAIPRWLSQRHTPELACDAHQGTLEPSCQSSIQARLTEEAEGMRWYVDWLARLERDDMVAVNLRPETDEATEYVPFIARGCCGGSPA
jgi:hypothetical protein